MENMNTLKSTNRDEQIARAYLNIYTSAEISYATLSELSEHLEDDRMYYSLLGVIQQVEKIKCSADLIDKVMRNGVLV